MKYQCFDCNARFNLSKKSSSSLVNITILTCHFCKSTNVGLSDIGKILIERKAKINKLESEKTKNKKEKEE